ncbi:MAG: VWA domain-containing protein [Chloroflexota bacterium]
MLRKIAARNLERLDALPPDVGNRLRQLQEYEFLDPDARERFEDLVEKLRRSTLDRYAKGLADAVKGMQPEDLAAQRQMVRDLNALLERRLTGDEPSQADIGTFMAQHGGFFPGARTLDDITEQLAQRMGAMQSLLQSMTPEQRRELQDAISALLRDDRLAIDLAKLAVQLDMVLPQGLGQPQPFSGAGPLGLEQALAQLDQLQALDSLEAQMDGTAGPGDLGEIDRDQVRDLLGPDAARELDALDDLTRRLEEAGYLERKGKRLELTPRATRRIGQKVLDELFAKLRRDAFGSHRTAKPGQGGEREEVSKPFEFGDPMALDLRATFGNALRRSENAPSARGDGEPLSLRLRPEDFEVYRTEQSTSAATVLMLDLSRSMLLRGCYLAAKRVAIALDALIRSEFPRDKLAIVGFAYSAHEIRPEALPELDYSEFEYGTNLQHGLALARRILARSHAANREVIVITDGEPTAHTERDGRVEFSYPPTARTIQETLREVTRCTRDGITINTFMLDRSPSLTNFVGYITELNRGRAFYAEPDRLGEYVLVDFVRNRRRRVG